MKRPRISRDASSKSATHSSQPLDSPTSSFSQTQFAFHHSTQQPQDQHNLCISDLNPDSDTTFLTGHLTGLPDASQRQHPQSFPASTRDRISHPFDTTGAYGNISGQRQGNLGISPDSFTSHQSGQSTEIGYSHDHDGGLANPVRLLAEAAEEDSHGSDLAENVIQDETLKEPALPPQYHIPETLLAMVTPEGLHSQIDQPGLEAEFLAEGLEKLLSDKGKRDLDSGDKRFFKPARREVKRDLGPEYNPLALALVTKREVEAFFGSFFSKLHPMLPVLDSSLHTPEFVESRSAFLLTAICAQGASLTPGAEQATKRLRIHAQRLSDMVSRRGFASVEIVAAFLIWISWLPSSESFQEERLWHETKYAINMAVELGLARPVLESKASLLADPWLSACLEDISLNNWDNVERIIRNRQRLWIHLFLWDSSLSLAFGKATRFTQDDLIRNENWCFHRLAIREDNVTTACVGLRRLLVGLSDVLRSEILIRCDMTSEWVVEKVDTYLGPWHKYWTGRCDGSAYLELMFRHTRLWSLSYGLQGLISRGGRIEALSKDCFNAALSSCEFVCQQLRASKGLWGFPNTMGPMLSFEALLAIRLFPYSGEINITARARLLGLLSQLSLLLEQIGTTPAHRLGTAAVYGHHLQVYIRRRILSLCLSHHQQETNQLGTITDPNSAFGRSFGSGTSPNTLLGTNINQFFGNSRVSPTDQTQASMNLNWDGVSTLNFLDTPSGWTDEFFRLFGGEQ
ncbi:hypothetical protein I302_100988 [Kwoniella bestiolae CBS 10118]|uniref:Xylanolytic transcriptional activator regulatory domain-containing protein n=1 Tax=Kwoniella bestiolae CBS 10118 TaxID=1296100 RepID=A0AAJ8K119_9TREE